MTLKKAITAGAAAMIFGAVIYLLVTREGGSDGGFIMEKGSLSLRDIRAAMKKIDFDDDAVREYFGGKVVNSHTVEFFNTLQHRFGTFKDLSDHFAQVRDYLYTVMTPAEAERLLDLYRAYVQYQKNLAADMRTWGVPAGGQGAVDYLRKVQEYRRNYFGRQTADILFGPSVMSKEYSIRRVSIICDDSLYGKEKEDRIKQLNDDMWGQETADIEDSMSPFSKYQEKLQIYRKDLGEMSEAEKSEKIAAFRSGLFSDEVVERFVEMDEQLADEKKREEAFRAREEKVLGNPNLNQEEKDKKILEIQDSIFGDEADFFRRREVFKKTVTGH